MEVEKVEYFRKRRGTTNVGKDYENILVAKIALQLVLDDTVNNFQLSRDDDEFGAFDDIVLQVEKLDGRQQNYALQLKHSNNNKILTKNSLTDLEGKFGIIKYFNDFNNRETSNYNDFKFAIFTNKKFNHNNDHIIVPTIGDVKFIQCGPGENSTINGGQGLCYKLETSDCSRKEVQHFFDKFLLYTNQLDSRQTKEQTSNEFLRRFSCEQSVFTEYIQFITEWSNREGRVEKLNKTLVKQVIAIRLLSPFIQPIPLGTNLYTPNSSQANLLRQAITKFDVATFKRMNREQISEIWADVRREFAWCDFRVIKNCGIKFEVISKHKIHINDLTDEECGKLMWLLGMCQVIVKNNKSIVKTINLLEIKNCVVVGNETLSEDIESSSIFRKLSDLKTETNLYAKIQTTFKCSLQQKPKILLKALIQDIDEIESCISTNELLLMLDDSFTIGEGEILPNAHIQRLLTRHIINYRFLGTLDGNTMVIISSEGQVDPPNSNCIVKYVDNHEQLDEFRNSERENQQIIYVTKTECSQIVFDAICEEIFDKTNFHQFKMVNNNTLEWVRSKNIDDLQEFRTVTDFIEQEDLCNYEDDNNTNILCANPGMGKSTLMKYIKNNSSPTFWSILIYPKDHSSYFREKGVDLNEFTEYILEETRKRCKHSFDVSILEALFSNNRVIFIWDGLDEVPEIDRETVPTVIEGLSQRKVIQWITARNNFKMSLEARFKVLSRTIKSFDEEQQKKYIKRRLNCSDDEMNDIFQKIKRNIQTYGNNSVVETPRQIYKLTELLLQNSQNRHKIIDYIFAKLTNQYDDTMKSSFENFTLH